MSALEAGTAPPLRAFRPQPRFKAAPFRAEISENPRPVGRREGL